MKQTRWTSTHTFLKLGLPFYTLLLFSLSGISSIAVTHAARLDCFPFCTLTPTPTSAFMPTATPTLMPTTSTLTPTPIPTLTPTQRPQPTPLPQAQPTIPVSVAPPLEPALTEVPPTVIPTDTPTTVTTTVIVTVTPHTIARTNTTSTNQQAQNTADKGINPVILPLGVGVALLLATGGIFWLLWRRQGKQYKPGIYPNTQASAWTNNYAVPPTLDPQYASLSAPFAPRVSGALPTASTQPMLSPQPTYTTTSDLHPATAPFSREMLTASLNNGASSAQNGSRPLLTDTSSLSPLSTGARATNRNGQTTPLPPARMDTPPPVSPMSPLTTHPPSIKDDPMLEEVMRQAQMGLFILSGR